MITFPLFWLAPLAKAFEDVALLEALDAVSTFSGLSAPLEENTEDVNCCLAKSLALPAGLEFFLVPAGGALLAKAAAADSLAFARATLLLFDGLLSSPKTMLERPPGGACTRVDGRSVMTLPQFWLAPLANAFEDVPP